MVAITRFFSRLSWDLVGFSASTLCAIHCVILPLLLLFTSFSGLEMLHNHRFESFVLLFSTIVGFISIIPSLRHHRKALPVTLLVAGLASIAFGRLDVSLMLEVVLTTTGALLVAFSHYTNWRLCRRFHGERRQRA